MNEKFINKLKEAIQIKDGLRNLYIEWYRVQAELSTFEEFKPVLNGNEISLHGKTIIGELLKPENVLPSEKSKLKRLPDGRYLKISIIVNAKKTS